ncbi:MAG: hypothetical protein AB1510_09620 [Bacillota bacterium]
MQIPNSRLEALVCIAEDLKTLVEKDAGVREYLSVRVNKLIPQLAVLFEKEPKGVQIISIAYFINRIVNDWREQILPLITYEEDHEHSNPQVDRQRFDNNLPG